MSLQQVLLYFYIKIIRNVSVITHVILINEGLQDKLIATGGYCIMNTDEGTGFLVI